MDFDTKLKVAIYRFIAGTARIPVIADIAPMISATPAEVREGFARLYANRVLVLNSDGETIRMAPPFSGVPTQHRVRVLGMEYYANCAWDSLGILAAMHHSGEVFSRCEQTHEPIHIVVDDADGLVPGEQCVVHFAVPASQWWKDIAFT